MRLDWRLGGVTGTSSMGVELSGDAGATFTAEKRTPWRRRRCTRCSSATPSDTWGRTWTAADLSNTNFRVRVISTSSAASKDFFLDWVPVRVTYGP